ncbi:MAG TPA: peptidylprolyl isomerase [Thermoanaerobaculia bacterium]|nr:peptidylprolyl isomerase [Thermoanaerobaculia bacterium]
MPRFFLTLLLLTSSASAATLPVLQREVLSEVYTIDRKYRSMEGPGSTKAVYLADATKPELLWLVGVKTEMVAADGKTPQLPELMCHVNVDYDAQRHQTLFNMSRLPGSRVVTLSQGVLATRVPDGFGFPVASNEPLNLFTQVLNHNIERPANIKVRHRVTFEYVRERDLKVPMKPLLNIGASGMVLLNDNPLAVPSPVDLGGAHGATCLMAPRAPNGTPTGSDYIDPQGRRFTGHWVVPPGRQENHSDVTWFMALPFDARLHYAAVHLHPFAESIALRDVTAKKTIFTARAKNPARGVGLDHVDSFASPPGVPLYRDHQYELVSVYDNPTRNTHDSMASVFLGVEDRDFVKPRPGDLAARAGDPGDPRTPDSALLETTEGAIALTLLPQAAPGATRQFAALARSGGLNGARITKIERQGQTITISFTAKTAEDRRLLFANLPVEPARAAYTSLSVCGASADAVRFAIVIGQKTAKRGCTVFAHIAPGAQSLRRIATAKVDESGRPLQPIAIVASAVYENGVKLP